MAIIVVENLAKQYPRKPPTIAVEGASLTLGPGRILGILGPSLRALWDKGAPTHYGTLGTAQFDQPTGCLADAH